MILAVCGSAPQLVGDGLVRTDIDPALGGGAAMEVESLLVVGLLAADDELVVLDADDEVVHGEAGDGERDAQRILAGLLDIVGRVPVGSDLADAVKGPLEMIEAEQQRRVEN